MVSLLGHQVLILWENAQKIRTKRNHCGNLCAIQTDMVYLVQTVTSLIKQMEIDLLG